MRIFAVDVGRASPLLAGFADPNRIADGVALIEDVIEPPFRGSDDDRAGLIFAPQ